MSVISLKLDMHSIYVCVLYDILFVYSNSAVSFVTAWRMRRLCLSPDLRLEPTTVDVCIPCLNKLS